VLLWASAWGAITALSRTVQGGEAALHLTLIRAAHGGLPFLLMLHSMRTPLDLKKALRLQHGVPAVFLLVAALVGGMGCADNPPVLTGPEPVQLRVEWTEAPAHRAIVSWSTGEAGTSHRVLFDTQPRGGTLAAYASAAAASSGEYQAGGPFFHHAELTDLLPSTAYYFVAVTDDARRPSATSSPPPRTTARSGCCPGATRAAASPFART